MANFKAKMSYSEATVSLVRHDKILVDLTITEADVTGENRAKRLYGQNYPRLQALKAKYE